MTYADAAVAIYGTMLALLVVGVSLRLWPLVAIPGVTLGVELIWVTPYVPILAGRAWAGLSLGIVMIALCATWRPRAPHPSPHPDVESVPGRPGDRPVGALPPAGDRVDEAGGDRASARAGGGLGADGGDEGVRNLEGVRGGVSRWRRGGRRGRGADQRGGRGRPGRHSARADDLLQRGDQVGRGGDGDHLLGSRLPAPHSPDVGIRRDDIGRVGVVWLPDDEPDPFPTIAERKAGRRVSRDVR